MRAATEGHLPPVMPPGNLVEVLGREVKKGSPGKLIVESSASRQRRPPCKTNKEMSDEAVDAAALTYLLTYLLLLQCLAGKHGLTKAFCLPSALLQTFELFSLGMSSFGVPIQLCFLEIMATICAPIVMLVFGPWTQRHQYPEDLSLTAVLKCVWADGGGRMSCAVKPLLRSSLAGPNLQQYPRKNANPASSQSMGSLSPYVAQHHPQNADTLTKSTVNHGLWSPEYQLELHKTKPVLGDVCRSLSTASCQCPTCCIAVGGLPYCLESFFIQSRSSKSTMPSREGWGQPEVESKCDNTTSVPD